MIKMPKIKLCFWRYHDNIQRTCRICGRGQWQINIREIVYGGFRNNWKDLN